MRTPGRNTQRAIILALLTTGFAALLVMMGDTDTADIMPFGRWCMAKTIAGAVTYGCWRLGRWLHANGMLPVIDEDEEIQDGKEDYYE